MPNRRSFLKTTSLAASAVALTSPAVAENHADLKNTKPDTFRKQLQECLGGPWPDPTDLNVNIRSSETVEGITRITLTYELEPGDPCPAILLIPNQVDASHPAPAVAIWHQHAGQYHLGKSEPAGLAGNPMHHTGLALAKLGYVVLCPDALCFEERQDPEGKLKGMQYERFEFLRYTVSGKCMAWKNILDMQRAVDFLVSRPEVLSDRMGCYGHSMGSTHTWLAGPFEPRLKALVGNCCLPTYAGIHRTKLLHCFPNFIPGIYEHGDTPDIAALIAPRDLHLNLGETDSGSPIEEAREGVETIRSAYEAAAAPEQFTAFIEPNTGHVLSPAMWEETKTFFDRHLKA
jgi:dienelactone hydrolase